MTSEPAPPGPIEHTTYARVGIFGNPSDQYGGRTIAFSLANFHAKAGSCWLWVCCRAGTGWRQWGAGWRAGGSRARLAPV